jgi:DUF1009 family protein
VTAGGKLGIIAGGGQAPKQLIEACRKLGRDFFVICLENFAAPDLADGLPHAWLHLGAASKLKDLVEQEQISEIIMLGHVRRPSLAEIRPDWLAMKVLTKIGLNSLGDDGLLTAIAKAFEAEGLRVIGAHEVFRDLLMPAGVLTERQLDAVAEADIARGIAVLQALGQVDIGQAVVVQQGIVLGVEAIEGTAALLQRVSSLRREGPGGVLVKMAKPQQDNRFDLPTIGPDTIQQAAAAGLRGVALEAGRGLLLDRENVLAAAAKQAIFVVGITP